MDYTNPLVPEISTATKSIIKNKGLTLVMEAPYDKFIVMARGDL